MGDKTGIAWAGMLNDVGEFVQGASWNLAAGCSKVNASCKFCYAMEVSAGLARKLPPGNRYEDLVKLTPEGWQWTNKVVPIPEKADEWIRKQGPKSVFMCSLTDLAHEDLSDEYVDYCLGMMAVKPRDRFYILTKRIERLAEHLSSRKEKILASAEDWLKKYPKAKHLSMPTEWPIPQLWIGTSPGDAKSRQAHYEALVRAPAAIRWVSEEPLIDDPGIYDLMMTMKMPPELRARHSAFMEGRIGGINPAIQWTVFGGESGPNARIMELEWLRNGIRDAQTLGCNVFVKQKGAVLARSLGCKDTKHGSDINEWPEDIRIQEFPKPELVLA
jgi:protein gp37